MYIFVSLLEQCFGWLCHCCHRGARAGFTSHETFKGVANISTVVGWPQYQIAMGSMIQCAALAKNTPGCQMYCYDNKNCVIITSGLEDSSGPQTSVWRCMFYGNTDNTPSSVLGYKLGYVRFGLNHLRPLKWTYCHNKLLGCCRYLKFVIVFFCRLEQ